jgi:hypothetical protein
MNKEFIPYEQVLALKELGFNEPAPLYQQAFKWFREKYNLPSHIATYWQPDWNDYSYQYNFVEDKQEWNGIEHYKTYEQAELECIKRLIEIVKEQFKNKK